MAVFGQTARSIQWNKDTASREKQIRSGKYQHLCVSFDYATILQWSNTTL